MPTLAGSTDASAYPLAGRGNVVSWRKPLLSPRTESGAPLQAPAAHRVVLQVVYPTCSCEVLRLFDCYLTAPSEAERLGGGNHIGESHPMYFPQRWLVLVLEEHWRNE